MEPEVPRPLLTLLPRASLFARLTLWERVDVGALDELLAQPSNQAWCLPRYRRLIEEDGRARVEYTKPLYGRAVVTGALGLHNMQRAVRARLARDYYVDWDMQNAHPTILLQVCQAHQVPCARLAHYVAEREQCLTEVQQHYGVARDSAKTLFLRMIFLGGFRGWAQALPPERRRATPFLAAFTQEMGRIAHTIVHCNRALTDWVREHRGGAAGNFDAAVLSTFLQEYECRALESLFAHCVARGLIVDSGAVLCNDGFMLERAHSAPELAAEFQALVRAEHGLVLEFVCKPMDAAAEEELDVAQVVAPLAPNPQADAHRHYMRHLYPAALLWRQATMGRAGYRRLAFVAPNGAFWRDPEARCVDWPAFQAELASRRPLQLHFDELRGDDGTEWRELVFDIDVTSFVRFCACGAEKRACAVCWLHIEGAALLLDHLLQELGLAPASLLWVLSGMKGFHCLCNGLPRADNAQRRRLLALLQRQGVDAWLAFARTLEPAFRERLEAHFQARCVEARDLLALPAFRARALDLLGRHHGDIAPLVAQRWAAVETGHWQELRALQRFARCDVPATLLLALACYYPVVDEGPLLSGSHLFKAPFSVHAETRVVSLPVPLAALVDGTAAPLPLLELSGEGAGGANAQFAAGLQLMAAWLDHAQAT